MDPKASRETLDHSIMYIFAVALEDGGWHHERSYAPERAARPTPSSYGARSRRVEDPEWTRRYHSHDPKEKGFGGRVVVTLKGGSSHGDEIALCRRAPAGCPPLQAAGLLRKFRTLAEGVIPALGAGPLYRYRRAAACFGPASCPPDICGRTVTTGHAGRTRHLRLAHCGLRFPTTRGRGL